MTEHSGAGLAFGVPFALRFADRVRLDAGAYEVAVLSHEADAFFLENGQQTITVSTDFSLQVPLAIWVQIVPRLWCGPFAFFTRHFTASPAQIDGPAAGTVGFPVGPSLVSSLGLGLGYQISDARKWRSQASLAERRGRGSRHFPRGSSAQGRNRTADTGIFSPLLYRLSYLREPTPERHSARLAARGDGRKGAETDLQSAGLSSARCRARSRKPAKSGESPRNLRLTRRVRS